MNDRRSIEYQDIMAKSGNNTKGKRIVRTVIMIAIQAGMIASRSIICQDITAKSGNNAKRKPIVRAVIMITT